MRERFKWIVSGLSAVRRRLGVWLPRGLGWLRAHPRRAVPISGGLLLLLLLGAWAWRRGIDRDLTTLVRRGTLTITLTESGALRPAASITYRSPLSGRELEITFLAAEGTRVGEGDLICRLDTTELEGELRRIVQELRQAEMDYRNTEVERREARAAVESLDQGAGSLGLDEARANLRVAEKKAERLKADYAGLKPLLDKGYITRDELERTGSDLEQAEAELQLARKKALIYEQRTYPYDRERARLQLAQKEAQLGNAGARVTESGSRGQELQQAIENCSIYAQRPGMVVYEEYMAANPRRKIRVGDRVTRSQGLITIPEVKRMVVESSIDEASVHKVKPGQKASIRPDAFPNLRLTGKVSRVGTLARASIERPFEDKRFDLIIDIDPTDAELRPEMTARVDILAGVRENVLLLPVNAIFERQGAPAVHVVGFFGLTPRLVELGESTDLYTEVTAGLREGERVTLFDVAQSVGSGPGELRSFVRPEGGGVDGKTFGVR
jgi:HlyD family secretion protein